MCDVAERLEKMGIAKGIELGREEQKKASRVEFILRVLENERNSGRKDPEKRNRRRTRCRSFGHLVYKSIKGKYRQEFEQALD